MSYFRRGLSGVQSQPQGGRVARAALGGVQSQPQGGRVARAALGGTVAEYSILSSTSLPKPPPPPKTLRAGRPLLPWWARGVAGTLGGDDATGHSLASSSLATPTISENDFRQQLLENSRAQLEHDKERIRKEEIRGYLQIGATLMIPVAAAVWRALGIGKKKKTLE